MTTMLDVGEKAEEQLAQLTADRPVAVVAVFRDEEGWHVTIDMLEMARIPESTDLLGVYEAVLDPEGNMLKFERKMTHNRGDILEEEA